jgi:hypothetical protein
VSIARNEEPHETREEAGQVELGTHEVNTGSLDAKLGAKLTPTGREARTLWKDAATTLQLERSALSPAPHEPVEVKFRIWLQPTSELPARGLDGACWKNYPMDPLTESPFAPELTLSASANETFAPECEPSGSAGLPQEKPSPLHALEELKTVELSHALFPAFRRLPNAILTSN